VELESAPVRRAKTAADLIYSSGANTGFREKSAEGYHYLGRFGLALFLDRAGA
jgi:hypothetical protein